MKFSMVPGRCFRQLMDGWEGRGKLSWLRSCEVTSIYCWKMFVLENLKGKCKDKTSGFVGIWNLLKENKIWPLHVYAFTFRIYLRIFCVFLDECLDQKSGFLKHVWLRQVTANQNYLRLLPTPFLHRGQAHHIDQKIVIPFCFISKTAPRKNKDHNSQLLFGEEKHLNKTALESPPFWSVEAGYRRHPYRSKCLGFNKGFPQIGFDVG